MLHSKC